MEHDFENLTMRDLCEHIVKADILQFNDGTSPTAEEIFNYSPSGELSQVFVWYEIACEVLGHKADEQESIDEGK